MARKANLLGETFTRLTVKEEAGVSKHGKVLWLCICECGNKVTVPTGALRSGNTNSCGCLNREINRNRHLKHGESFTKFYKHWLNMVNRCTNPSTVNYKYYGGEGIKVCERWLDYDNFKEDMYESFEEHSKSNKHTSLERLDHKGNYCPENCTWATMKEQGYNRRNTTYLTFNGEKKTIEEWSKITGIKKDTIRSRVFKYHWTAERALTEKASLSKTKRESLGE